MSLEVNRGSKTNSFEILLALESEHSSHEDASLPRWPPSMLQESKGIVKMGDARAQRPEIRSDGGLLLPIGVVRIQDENVGGGNLAKQVHPRFTPRPRLATPTAIATSSPCDLILPRQKPKRSGIADGDQYVRLKRPTV